MATDIYGRVIDLGTPMAADATRLLLNTTGGIDQEEELVQNFASQYQQNINRLWEVGSANTYFIAGRTQGSLAIKRIIGGQGPSKNFIEYYGNVCNIQNTHFTIQISAGCTSSNVVGGLKFDGVVINSIGYSVAAADMIINEDISCLFAMLEFV